MMMTCSAHICAYPEAPNSADGYIRLLRTPTPACAEDVRPYDGNACRNATDPVKEVRVCGACGILYEVSVPIVTAADKPDKGAAQLRSSVDDTAADDAAVA